MILFADANSETVAWVAFGGTALAGLAKFTLDMTANRFTQRQADRDKAFDEMGKVLAHAQADIAKLELRLDRETERNDRCERRAAYLETRVSYREQELRDAGHKLAVYPEFGEGSVHRPISSNDEEGAA